MYGSEKVKTTGYDNYSVLPAQFVINDNNSNYVSPKTCVVLAG